LSGENLLFLGVEGVAGDQLELITKGLGLLGDEAARGG